MNHVAAELASVFVGQIEGLNAQVAPYELRHRVPVYFDPPQVEGTHGGLLGAPVLHPGGLVEADLLWEQLLVTAPAVIPPEGVEVLQAGHSLQGRAAVGDRGEDMVFVISDEVDDLAARKGAEEPVLNGLKCVLNYAKYSHAFCSSIGSLLNGHSAAHSSHR